MYTEEGGGNRIKRRVHGKRGGGGAKATLYLFLDLYITYTHANTNVFFEVTLEPLLTECVTTGKQVHGSGFGGYCHRKLCYHRATNSSIEWGSIEVAQKFQLQSHGHYCMVPSQSFHLGGEAVMARGRMWEPSRTERKAQK
jgi:hypothetical protein